MESLTLNIEGMSCEMCVGHVTKALAGLGGVLSAAVSLPQKTAVVTYDPAVVGLPQMAAAVEEEGYAASART